MWLFFFRSPDSLCWQRRCRGCVHEVKSIAMVNFSPLIRVCITFYLFKKYVDREKIKQYLLKGSEEFRKIAVTIELPPEQECVGTSCPVGQKCVITLNARDRILPYAPDGYKSFSRGFKCVCLDDSEGL